MNNQPWDNWTRKQISLLNKIVSYYDTEKLSDILDLPIDDIQDYIDNKMPDFHKKKVKKYVNKRIIIS